MEMHDDAEHKRLMAAHKQQMQMLQRHIDAKKGARLSLTERLKVPPHRRGASGGSSVAGPWLRAWVAVPFRRMLRVCAFVCRPLRTLRLQAMQKQNAELKKQLALLSTQQKQAEGEH